VTQPSLVWQTDAFVTISRLIDRCAVDKDCLSASHAGDSVIRDEITEEIELHASAFEAFGRLEGLLRNARFDPGAKMAALQPVPIGLTSMRYPLYSIAVIACAIGTAAQCKPLP
jgi:hypothetical protein